MDIKYQVDFNPNTLFHSKYSPLNSVLTGSGSFQSLVCLQTFLLTSFKSFSIFFLSRFFLLVYFFKTSFSLQNHLNGHPFH